MVTNERVGLKKSTRTLTVTLSHAVPRPVTSGTSLGVGTLRRNPQTTGHRQAIRCIGGGSSFKEGHLPLKGESLEAHATVLPLSCRQLPLQF